jgi:outer membrane lipoprotein-sorting protein
MIVRVAALLLTCAVCSACGAREDPARTELRERLEQGATLSSEELARFRAEVSKSVEGQIFVTVGPVAQELDAEQRATVFGMLTEPAGMFDEGIRREQGVTFRVLNAPGRSTSQEIEASRRLWVDVETFLPRRFEFTHAFQGYDDYSFDLTLKGEQ